MIQKSNIFIKDIKENNYYEYGNGLPFEYDMWKWRN